MRVSRGVRGGASTGRKTHEAGCERFKPQRNDDGGCVLSLIDLTPGLAKLALRRIDDLGAIQSHDRAADEIYYWNYDAVFFNPFRDAGDNPEGSAIEADELLDRLAATGNDFVEVGATFKVPESQIAAVDCCQMITRKEGMAFVAIPKHASFYVETIVIPIDVLRRAASPRNPILLPRHFATRFPFNLIIRQNHKCLPQECDLCR